MNGQPTRTGRITGIVLLLAIFGVLIWAFTRPPQRPESPRLKLASELAEVASIDAAQRRDAELVRQLLNEDLGQRRFSFPTVVRAVSGKRMIPLDEENEAHTRVLAALDDTLASATGELSQAGSPVRELRRINEASRIFEDFLLDKLDAIPGISCGIPPTREGEAQRSGYPDLRVIDEASGMVFYLDPKLFEESSRRSSLRTFYFEPKDSTLKINEDAVHLLIGISHDGKSGGWTFGNWEIVDLSELEVRLKAEFQASNADLYSEP